MLFPASSDRVIDRGPVRVSPRAQFVDDLPGNEINCPMAAAPPRMRTRGNHLAVILNDMGGRLSLDEE